MDLIKTFQELKKRHLENRLDNLYTDTISTTGNESAINHARSIELNWKYKLRYGNDYIPKDKRR